MKRIKLLFALLMGVLILFTAQRVHFAKSDTLNDIYSDIVFTRLAVETRQYTRQIEYGLENGKRLENFYNMQSVLSDVKRCSSYIRGVYIVSGECRPMYSLADEEGGIPARIRVPVGESFFSVYEESADRFLLSVAVNGQNEAAAGYLVLVIGHDITDNPISDSDLENLIQISVTGALSFLSGVWAIIHLCRREKRILSDSMKAVLFSVCMETATDGAISVFKLRVMIDSLIRQSVSKITMALQNDLDTVKGFAGRIYDLNSWLFESCRQVPYIDSLSYDKGYKIYAIVSENYAAGQIARYGAFLAEAAGICVLAGALLCVLGALADQRINQRRDRERYADVKRERAGGAE